MAAQAPTFRGGFVNWGDKNGFPNTQDVQAFLQSTALSTQVAFANTIMRGATNTSALYLLSGCTRGTGTNSIAAGFAMYYDSGGTSDLDGASPRFVFAPVTASTGTTINLYKRTVVASFNDKGTVTSGDAFYEYRFANATPSGGGWATTPYKSNISTYGSAVFDLTNGMWNAPVVTTQSQIQASKKPGTYYIAGAITDSTTTIGDTNSIWKVEVYGWGGIQANLPITVVSTANTIIEITYHSLDLYPYKCALRQTSLDGGTTWGTFNQDSATYLVSATQPTTPFNGLIWMDIS
jgi:hypothetical protein